MTDSALAEFSFVKTFFHAEDSAVFNEIFRDVCKYVPLFPRFHVAANADGGVVHEFGGLRGRFAGGDAHPIGCDGFIRSNSMRFSGCNRRNSPFSSTSGCLSAIKCSLASPRFSRSTPV